MCEVRGWRLEAKNSEVVASASNLKRSGPQTSNQRNALSEALLKPLTNVTP